MANAAARKDQKAASTSAADPVKKKRKTPLLIMAIALVTLSGGGGAAWYWTQQRSAAPEVAPSQEKPPVFLPLEPFTVNLQPEREDQYLQVGLALKVTEAGAANALKLHMPEVRNRILLLLSAKKASEISTVTGKQQLSAEIMNELKQLIAAQKLQQDITDVYFTSFVIQ